MAINTATGTVVTSTGTTEAVAATTPLVTTNLAGSSLAIWGSVNILTGTGGTLLSIKCRRGNAITGAQVGSTHTSTTVQATNHEIPFTFIDTAPVASSQYSITLTENSGTWTANFIHAFTEVITGQG